MQKKTRTIAYDTFIINLSLYRELKRLIDILDQQQKDYYPPPLYNEEVKIKLNITKEAT